MSDDSSDEEFACLLELLCEEDFLEELQSFDGGVNHDQELEDLFPIVFNQQPSAVEEFDNIEPIELVEILNFDTGNMDLNW